MRKNAFNVTLFMFLAGGLFFLLQYVDKNLPKNPKKDPAAEKVEEEAKKNAMVAAGGGLAVAGDLPKSKPPEAPKVEPVAISGLPIDAAANAVLAGVVGYAERPILIVMGDDKNFYNRIVLSTRGGGVQQVTLPRFDQADRLGREVKIRDANGNPTKEPLHLHLLPGVVQPRGKFLREEYAVPELPAGKIDDPARLTEPSYTLFHYATPDEKFPDPYLGETNWTIAEEDRPEGGDHKVVFEKELGEPYFVKLRKIYTLGPKDYHVGLKIEVERMKVPGAVKGKGQLRLQLSGPRGIPIEGEWFTTTFRVGIIGWKDKSGTPRRQYEDSASVAQKRGGDLVSRGENTFNYMVVANQYFASGVAIDYSAEGSVKTPWSYVRTTTELPFDKKHDPNLPYFDDMTVRAAFETIDLAPAEKLTHNYLIYNGPAKVGLLKLMPKERGLVDDALVDRYKDTLGLSTITDFRSDNWLGRFANAIYWTDLVIAVTNLMHLFLAVIHKIVPSWAFSIIMLTVMVRLMLFYPSRKQTAMSMKMMEVQKKLQPEFEKLQEKYKDDMHSYNREKTRLMMQHGANPFAMMGGCLLLLAQMPIMMGLYFCLQESVFFRLEPFLWVDNLAAPDMLIWWTEQIPYISTPEDIGSIIYLGPFFNLLPILAVGLMLYQQAKMMPPSTDPQAEQQRFMMKIMMIMMALFFYKVAAGLALYFIVSTAWAIIERQFIPKPIVNGDGGDSTDTTADTKPKSGSPNGKASTTPLSPTAAAAVEAAQKKSKGLLGRLRAALEERMKEMQRQADEQSRRQIRNATDRPATNGNPPPPDSGTTAPQNKPRRDKKKKRRK